MSYENILFEVSDAVATITLNRPDKLNAYVPAMGAEIVDAFERASGDDRVRAMILTGAGRAFCAGVDLDYVKGVAAGTIEPSDPPLGQEDFVRQWPLALLDSPKPIIAAINGAAVGVGTTMILPCDIRIATAGAKLRLNFAALGMLPGLGSTHHLPALVGAGHALDLILSSATLTAERGAEIGLIQEVTPADDLLAAAQRRAAAIAAARPEVIAAAKKLLRAGARDAAATAMQRERESSSALRR